MYIYQTQAMPNCKYEVRAHRASPVMATATSTFDHDTLWLDSEGQHVGMAPTSPAHKITRVSKPVVYDAAYHGIDVYVHPDGTLEAASVFDDMHKALLVRTDTVDEFLQKLHEDHDDYIVDFHNAETVLQRLLDWASPVDATAVKQDGYWHLRVQRGDTVIAQDTLLPATRDLTGCVAAAGSRGQIKVYQTLQLAVNGTYGNPDIYLARIQHQGV